MAMEIDWFKGFSLLEISQIQCLICGGRLSKKYSGTWNCSKCKLSISTMHFPTCAFPQNYIVSYLTYKKYYFWINYLEKTIDVNLSRASSDNPLTKLPKLNKKIMQNIDNLVLIS